MASLGVLMIHFMHITMNWYHLTYHNWGYA